jgi:PAS domain S-box-containing protein
MPGFTTLDFILFAYFLGATVAIIIYAFLLEKFKKQSTALGTANAELTGRLHLFQNQLTLIEARNQKNHDVSELETIFNQIDMGVVVLSSQSTIISINPYAERHFGIRKMDVLTKPSADYIKLVDAADKPENYALDQALHGKTASLPIWTFSVIGNEKIPLIGEFTPLVNPEGTKQILFNFFAAGGIFSETWNLLNRVNDISGQYEQKSLQYDELKRSMDISARLVSRLDLAVIILDAQGKIIQINPFAEKFLGVLKNECLAKSYREVIITKNTKGVIDFSAVEKALTGSEAAFAKWTQIATHTGVKAISGACVPLTTENHDLFICIYFIDVTQEYTENTEEKAFFSSSAHDLRSPLTTIRGVTEVLEGSFDKMPVPQVRELLTGAKESAIHLIDLVNDLLNVSRIDQGRVVINRTAFNIVSLTRDIVNNMQYSAKAKRLYLNYNVTDNAIPKAYGDESKTIDVITNLISNAVKYTQSGGITITQNYDEGNIVTLVSDTGIGISPENITLLFHKFQQVGASRYQPMTKSTGLGLYIAKKFAVLMGGDITLEKSELEKGSTFKFTLPVAPGN